MGIERIVGSYAAVMLLLLGKDMRLVFIIQMVVNHAPDGRFSGMRYKGNGLYGMLPVKNVVDAVSSADLDGVDLV